MADCDLENPGSTFVAVNLKAWGALDHSQASVQMLPDGSVTKVKGTIPQQVYLASYAMQTFSTSTLAIYGRVLDENGTLVDD